MFENAGIKERIKEIRTSQNLTQEKFASRLRTSRANIAGYEAGTRTPSEAALINICREFNVNEDWLRNGTGEMFIEMDKEDQLMEWAGRVLGSRSTSFKKNFVKMMMSLTEDEWELLERKARELMNYENDE